MDNNQLRWTRDWRGFFVGAAAGVVVALVLAITYYFILIWFAPRLVYQTRTHILGWVLCQAVLALLAYRAFEQYPSIAVGGSLTSVIALAAAFFELSFGVQIGI